MLSKFLEIILLGPQGLSSSGVPLALSDGNNIMLFAKLGAILADGDGLRAGLDWRGASSLKPCFRHANLFKKDSGLAQYGRGCVELSCCDFAALRAWTGAEACDAMDLLLAAKTRVDTGRMTKARFDSLEKMHGLRANEHGVLANARLRPLFDVVQCTTYDWFHSMLQDGVFTREVGLLLKAAEPYGVTMESVRIFLKDDRWQFPQAMAVKSKQLHLIFHSYRSGDTGDTDKVKASASELLGLYSLLRHFVEINPDSFAALQLERKSFVACCKVLDYLLETKRGFISARDLSDGTIAAVQDMLRSHISAYGTSHLIPKRRWMMDIPEQIHRDNLVLDCFIIERGHLLVKGIADHVRNTACFERSVLSGVLNLQHRHARDTHTRYGLRGKVASWQEGFVGHHLSLAGLDISSGDVVFCDGRAAQVEACILNKHTLAVVVSLLTVVEVLSPHSARHRTKGEQAVWLAAVLRPGRAWYVEDNGLIVVIHT